MACCGTGLSGKLFKEIASPLIGVDLSSQMIAKTKEKDIYDELIQGDLFHALKNHPHNELILASDVLAYLGDLSILFHSVNNALMHNGLFAFTIEIAPDQIDTYTLQHSIRSAHSPQYIEKLAAQNQLSLLKKQKITLRMQHNKPLEGLVYIHKKEDSFV